jgi:NAD(P)-dependent dehydrogenase (short-subunit alcohol dehydrogenase family)
MKFPQAPRAVITGGGSGLGRAFALKLAPRGARMLVLDVNVPGAEETARLVAGAGGTAVALRCDVSRAEEVERAALAADERWGGADILVNNAGVAAVGPVGELPLKDWNWIVGINLMGVVHGCHAFVPRMKKAGRGFILNVASSAGFASLPEMGAYNVTKAGVISLSETLAGELAAHGVSVSVLCPTFVNTNLLASLRATDAEQRDLAAAMFRRATITPEQVAHKALRGLEKGRLMIIPQADGAAVWRAKRFAPGLYQFLVRTAERKGLREKLRRRMYRTA